MSYMSKEMEARVNSPAYALAKWRNVPEGTMSIMEEFEFFAEQELDELYSKDKISKAQHNKQLAFIRDMVAQFTHNNPKVIQAESDLLQQWITACKGE